MPLIDLFIEVRPKLSQEGLKLIKQLLNRNRIEYDLILNRTRIEYDLIQKRIVELANYMAKYEQMATAVVTTTLSGDFGASLDWAMNLIRENWMKRAYSHMKKDVAAPNKRTCTGGFVDTTE
jgi:hypothetical protein